MGEKKRKELLVWLSERKDDVFDLEKKCCNTVEVM